MEACASTRGCKRNKVSRSYPLKLWDHCILDAAYVINGLLSIVLEGKSPYETFFNKQPSASHLRILRCIYVATALLKEDKFSSRGDKTVFMEYSSITKGYILYDLEKHLFFANKDVIFRECLPISASVNRDR